MQVCYLKIFFCQFYMWVYEHSDSLWKIVKSERYFRMLITQRVMACSFLCVGSYRNQKLKERKSLEQKIFKNIPEAFFPAI